MIRLPSVGRNYFFAGSNFWYVGTVVDAGIEHGSVWVQLADASIFEERDTSTSFQHDPVFMPKYTTYVGEASLIALEWMPWPHPLRTKGGDGSNE